MCAGKLKAAHFSLCKPVYHVLRCDSFPRTTLTAACRLIFRIIFASKLRVDISLFLLECQIFIRARSFHSLLPDSAQMWHRALYSLRCSHGGFANQCNAKEHKNCIDHIQPEEPNHPCTAVLILKANSSKHESERKFTVYQTWNNDTKKRISTSHDVVTCHLKAGNHLPFEKQRCDLCSLSQVAQQSQ